MPTPEPVQGDALAPPRPMTCEGFMAQPEGRRHNLVDGLSLHAPSAGRKHREVLARILVPLRQHAGTAVATTARTGAGAPPAMAVASWIVEPHAETVEIFRPNASGDLASIGAFGRGDRFASAVPPGLFVDLESLFEEA